MASILDVKFGQNISHNEVKSAEPKNPQQKLFLGVIPPVHWEGCYKHVWDMALKGYVHVEDMAPHPMIEVTSRVLPTPNKIGVTSTLVKEDTHKCVGPYNIYT